MIRNYFKTAIRSLWKKKGFSFLNIAGLAIGITCAALIFLWVEDELTFNNYFTNRENIGQIMTNQSYDKETYTFASTPGLLAAALKNEVPQVREAVRCNWGSRGLLSQGEKKLFADGLVADPGFLNMFNLEFTQGSPDRAFSQLYSIILTERMALKLFNNTNVVGQTIKLNNEHEYLVSGVYKTLPANARFEKVDWIAPFAIFEKENPWLQYWGNNGVQTFVELQPGTDIRALNKKLDGFIKAREKDLVARPLLLPMKDWRLRNNFENGVQSGGRIKQVKLFSLIAWIIVLLACINFMNLATARSEQRAREVGVRKVLGSGKSALIGQFILEALIMSFIAVVLAVVITSLLLPAFNGLVEKQMQLNLFSPMHIIALTLITLTCGIIAGSYPAFYLSSFNPIAVLKGLKLPTHFGATLIRKGLVTAQFVISIALIICTLIIYQQIMHTKNRDLGMNKNNLVFMDQQVITTQQDSLMGMHFNTLRQDLAATGVVEHASLNSNPAFSVGSNSSNYSWKGKDPTKEILIGMDFVTAEYVKTMGMQLIAGRDFYTAEPEDTASVIINESMARLIAPKTEAVVGQTLDRSERKYTIVGVVKNFIYNNMYGSAQPVVFYIDNKAQSTAFLNIRFKPTANYSASLEKVKKVMSARNPNYPLEFHFVDDEFDKLFKGESLLGTLAALFAGLAIFISCLGLFGLAAYTAEKRIKEIGIRKVLGASVSGIVSLLSADFLKLVALSCLIAFPIAWWAMHSWLEGYEYRIGIQWWMFAMPALLAMVIAILTVSFQAVKAALANPVKSLRTE